VGRLAGGESQQLLGEAAAALLGEVAAAPPVGFVGASWVLRRPRVLRWVRNRSLV
jgi:hypothetical protein